MWCIEKQWPSCCCCKLRRCRQNWTACRWKLHRHSRLLIRQHQWQRRHLSCCLRPSLPATNVSILINYRNRCIILRWWQKNSRPQPVCTVVVDLGAVFSILFYSILFHYIVLYFLPLANKDAHHDYFDSVHWEIWDQCEVCSAWRMYYISGFSHAHWFCLQSPLNTRNNLEFNWQSKKIVRSFADRMIALQ